MKIAVVGATGLVGQEMLRVLEEEQIQINTLIPVASESSVGKTVSYKGRDYKIVVLEEAVALRPDIAIFSAGSDISKKWAPKFVDQGTFVIDNSSAWRMVNDIPLIVPEINGSELDASQLLIANPNCSTIQMVMALAPLHKRYVVKRVVVATYQSVTGSGNAARLQLENERAGIDTQKVYPHSIDMNLIPEAGTFENNGYTTEEIKLDLETKKILGDNTINVTATAVRVPVTGGHSESVNIEFENNFEISDIKNLLTEFPGITVMDDPLQHIYPMPVLAKGKNDVFVGRIRRDHSIEKGLNLWIVSDNLRKGAATNAVQIASLIIKKGLLSREGV